MVWLRRTNMCECCQSSSSTKSVSMGSSRPSNSRTAHHYKRYALLCSRSCGIARQVEDPSRVALSLKTVRSRDERAGSLLSRSCFMVDGGCLDTLFLILENGVGGIGTMGSFWPHLDTARSTHRMSIEFQPLFSCKLHCVPINLPLRAHLRLPPCCS
jgi:hypothetical protein